MSIKVTPIRVIISLGIMASLLDAQKITDVKFEGLAHLSPTVAKETSGIRIDEELDVNQVNKSIKEFFAQGYFKDIWVEEKNGVLTYHFKEKPSIAHIEIKGYGSAEDSEALLKGANIKKGDLYDERGVQKAKQAIIKQLESQGYYDTVVEIKKSDVGQSGVSIVYDVNKGSKIIIKKINYVGAKELDSSDFDLETVNKEEDYIGWFPWMNNGEATAEQLQYDGYRIEDMYRKHGYMDAKVEKPLMKVDFGSYSANVDYKITEGIQYRVGELSITQDIKGLNIQELEENLKLKKDKIFNIKKMRLDIKNITEAVGNLGYAYAKVLPQMNKNSKSKTIGLNYIVQPGELVKINDVLISGNNVTRDRVVRRYVYLAPGDLFSTKDLKDSKGALGRTGFFESVDIKQERVDDNKVNLIVTVKEAPTGQVSAGGGYGSYDGFMIMGSLSDKNFFGTGISSTISFQRSDVATNYNLSFTNPKVWDSMYSLSMSTYKSEQTYDDTFSDNKVGSNITVGKEFERYFHASAGLGYLNYEDPGSVSTNFWQDNNIDPSSFEPYEKSSIFLNGSFDNRDDYYTPREGVYASLNVEVATLDSSEANYNEFVKISSKVGLYYGLEDTIDYDLILRAKGRLTTVMTPESNDVIPFNDLVFMGGIGTVRGFEPYSFSGKNMASGSLEASVPLSEAAKMRIAAFYDFGMVGSSTFDDNVRSSVGLALEWQSMFGPINIVFAQPIDDEAGDKLAKFEFSMGTKF